MSKLLLNTVAVVGIVFAAPALASGSTPYNYGAYRGGQQQGQPCGNNCGTNDIAKVRQFLQNYNGPYWTPTQADGPIINKYMNKMPPPGAIPCKPPGYDHMVFCVKR